METIKLNFSLTLDEYSRAFSSEIKDADKEQNIAKLKSYINNSYGHKAIEIAVQNFFLYVLYYVYGIIRTTTLLPFIFIFPAVLIIYGLIKARSFSGNQLGSHSLELLSGDDQEMMIQPTELTLDKEGITHAKAGVTIHLVPGIIKCIKNDNDKLYLIYYIRGQYIIVPERAFESVKQKESFLQTIGEWAAQEGKNCVK